MNIDNETMLHQNTKTEGIYENDRWFYHGIYGILWISRVPVREKPQNNSYIKYRTILCRRKKERFGWEIPYDFITHPYAE